MPLPRAIVRKLWLCVLLVPLAAAQARVGDTIRDMDGRILQPNLGRHFSFRGLDEREKNQMVRESPVTPFAALLPQDSREVVYWKSAMRRQLNNEDGWRVHVHFWKDRSVLEAYRRVGESLSEFEVNAILALHRGSGAWQRVEKGPGGKQDPADTVIGYDFQLGEDGLRARVQGNWMLIYLTRFDKMLVERKKVQDELAAVEREEKRQAQQKKAPESIEGF